jgi:hypothetical protein
MQHVEQFRRVFGQSVVRLNLAELRRRPAIADDRPLPVFFTVAEPLRQHSLAGDFTRDLTVVRSLAASPIKE